MRHATSRATLLSLAMLVATACNSYQPIQLVAETRPDSVAVRGAARVMGRSCQDKVLWIPVNSGNTLRQALDAAKSAGKTAALTDVTADASRSPGFFWTRHCTIVHGVPARSRGLGR